MFFKFCHVLKNSYICIVTRLHARTPDRRPFSWTGKARFGHFRVNWNIGEEWIYAFYLRDYESVIRRCKEN